MTPDTFRELALALPGAVEASHMGHPDFRVGGRIFATLLPQDGAHAMVKLTPEQQAPYLERGDGVYRPAAGAWGKGGATLVALRPARAAEVRKALETAWRNLAPRGLLAELPPTGTARKSRKAAGASSTPLDVQHLALSLPETEEGPCYGTPGFRVRGKLFARLLEDGDTLVVRMDQDSREALLEARPAVFFLTDHYLPHCWVLVRISAIGPEELRGILRDAWSRRAPRRLVPAGGK